MSRILAVVFLGGALTGCQSSNSQGPVDPFLGPTRVPPPQTGSVFTPPPDSYYYSPPPQHPASHSGNPIGPFSHAALPAGNPERPGVGVDAGSSAEGWSATPSFSGASLVSQGATPDLQPQPGPHTPAPATVNREPIIRILEPPTRAVLAQSPSPPQAPPTRVVNIVDLPRASESATPGFRLVSAVEPSDPTASVVRAVAEQPTETFTPSSGHYGYDPSYAWLRGKLEYSQVDRRWKLRYIPIDGKTDQYGGSVVIANEAALAGSERGEFVAVRGRVTHTESQHDFAPTYEVTTLERLGR